MYRFRSRSGSIRLALLSAILLTAGKVGCALRDDAPSVAAGNGIQVRQVQSGIRSVRVIEADLATPGVQVRIAADEVALRQGRISGRARNVPDWLRATGAAAGVNGGFFGENTDEHHRELVGLLKLAGRVRAPASLRHSRPEGHPYTRCAFGVTAQGSPRMAWVSSPAGQPQLLRSYVRPEASAADAGIAWNVEQALQCGPRLIHGGRIDLTAREERLVSPGPLPRTFLGYGGANRRYLVLCATGGMSFEDCARFLMEYFQHRYGVPCSEAMCFDGGSSTQAAWRQGEGTKATITGDFSDTTEVPTAVLVYAGRAARRP